MGLETKAMAGDNKQTTRAERLAAQLRANLKKRKAQARRKAINEAADAPVLDDAAPAPMKKPSKAPS